MKIDRLDHLVLTVQDIEATIRFYESVLGMRREVFGENRVALKFGDQKINLHPVDAPYTPKAKAPLPGSEDLCFVTVTPLQEAMEHVRSMGIPILEGPVSRTGAKGPILSFYFRDPDGNLIEIAHEC